MSAPREIAPAPRPERGFLILPAYDEGARIGEVLDRVGEVKLPLTCLVVDDGSTDDTASRAAEAGAAVLRLPFNCGIGASVQAGLRVGVRRGYQVVARLDGDGQHDARDLPTLLARLREGDADFALGSRYVTGEGYQSSTARRAGSRWFSTILRLACGIEVSDPTSGCWAANRRAAELLAAEYASDYPEVDSLVHLARAGCRIAEVPVSMRERVSGRSSIGATRALYYMIKVTIALLVGRLRPPAGR